MSQAEAPPPPSLASLETLYDAHHRRAIGLAYRLLGDQAEAEEVVQEMFLAIWRRGDTYDPSRGATHTWVLAMVRNRAIDVLRARRRRPVQALDETVDPPDPADVASQATASVDAATARAALARLPPEQQQVIELAYFAGLSHSEIAAQIAAPVGTVKGRIRLALDHLRSAIGAPRDAFSTS